ncbi:MAG: FAD-dependent oxidoreductase [Planctomycetota bacterium]
MNDALRHDRVPTWAEVDVLVVGAGSSGCCAAIAAAEGPGSPSVALVDRYGFPGGVSTQALDTFYGFYTPGDDAKRVVGGLPARVVDTLDDADVVFLRPNTYGAGTGVNYNPERLKLVWDELLAAAGVRVLLHSRLIDVETSGDRPVAAVVLGKQDLGRIVAKRFVDASGDADFCHFAGIAYEKAGESEPAQTMTTTFRMANVDLDRYAAAGGKKRLATEMADAVETGTHELPRKAGSVHRMNVAGCISTVAVRVAGYDPTDSEQLAAAEREGRRQAFVYERFLRDRVPGFADANIIGLSSGIGVRESRRVYGEYRLTREDCLTAARFDDAVLLCGAPIEDHRPAADGEDETVWEYVPAGDVYEVPYRTLVPRGSDTVWVTGRCFSATHDAHASCRSMGQTMAMGEAAGTAAALSLAEDAGARSLDVTRLRESLADRGAVLERPDLAADTSADGWRRDRRKTADGVAC